MSISRELAEFVAGTPIKEIPREALDQAKRAILDTLGVTLAGCREEAATIVADRVQKACAGGNASVLGWPLRVSAEAAALVNGTAAHALDYDDVSYSMRGHPSAPVLPAVLAAGEACGASGAETLAAFVIGVEVEAKLGLLMGGRHYALGWHPTSTIGSLGAAAGAARLLRLGPSRVQAALGIAASMAAGIRANFGTMTKPLHAGLAARNGVEAAFLADAGFTASAEAIEGVEGFLAAFLGEPEGHEWPSLRLGDPYEVLTPGLAQKLYPCCYATHRAVDAAIAVGEVVKAGEISSASVTVSRGTLMPLISGNEPSTGLEGKFSLEYCVATAISDGRVRIASFTDAAVHRPQVRDLMRRIQVSEDQQPLSNPLQSWAEMVVRTTSGSEERRRVEVPRGDPRRPLLWDELAEKFRDCSAAILDAADADQIVASVASLEHLSDITLLTRRLNKEREIVT